MLRSFQPARLRAVAVLATAACAWATNAYGQTAVTWDGTVGSYTTATNWDPDTVPSNAGNHFLMINNGGTAIVGPADTDAQGTALHLGLRPGESGNLQVDGGTLTLGELRVGGLERIPDLITPANPSTPNAGGTGTVIQTGGTVNLTYSTGTEPPRQSLWIGDSGLNPPDTNSANGTYKITGGTLLNGIAATDGIFVGTGNGAKGTFIQEGGTVTSTGLIMIGRRGAQAQWTMSGGTLNQQATTGTGFVIADGINDSLTPAVAAPGTTGTFTQTGGTLNVAFQVEVGRRTGTGVFNMSGGRVNTTASFIVGSVATATAGLTSANGTLNLSPNLTGGANPEIFVGTNMNVGFGSATTLTSGVGTVNQTGGLIMFNAGNAIFAVGNGNGTNGTVDLAGGKIDIQGNTSLIDIGRNSGSGLLRVRGTGSLDARQVTVNSGSVADRTRELRIEGGTVDVDVVTFGTVASLATRALNISGGNVHFGQLVTGQATGAGSAVTHISGYNTLDIDTLEIFSGSRFKTSTNVTLDSVTTFGNATVETAVGALTFNAPGSFGTGTNRTLTKVGPGTMTVAAPQTYAANSAIINNEGTLNLNTQINGNLAVTANAATNFGANARLTSLTAGPGATATLVNDGSANRVINTDTVTIDPTGRVDLKNNKLITNTPIGTASGGVYAAGSVQREVQRAYHEGAWDQPGLTTSEPKALEGLTTIAVATGEQIGVSTFAGQSVSPTSTIAFYTYGGDTNFDGMVSGDDYGTIDFAILVPGSDGYYNGDFNYDGVINGDDYGIIDFTIIAQGAPFPTSGGSISGVTAVPEPASLGLLALSAGAAIGRRRRRRE